MLTKAPKYHQIITEHDAHCFCEGSIRQCSFEDKFSDYKEIEKLEDTLFTRIFSHSEPIHQVFTVKDRVAIYHGVVKQSSIDLLFNKEFRYRMGYVSAEQFLGAGALQEFNYSLSPNIRECYNRSIRRGFAI